ncbi:MAG: 50S ribosomal protein L5 [Sphaerochaetaceae bacterium]|jgi:large subunit ribosomal protein L5
MAEEKNVQEAAPKKTAAPKKAEAKKPEAPAEKFVPNFKRKYLETVAPALFKEHGYKSPMQVPKLEKIVVSIGCGDAIENKKLLDSAVKELEQITGQHVVKTKARKSIANFKLREGQEIGAMVTLRGDNMWYFLERLICIALPRVKDFRGVNPNAFDGRGNYSLGITEQIIFPEIDFDKIERISGMNVAIVTTAKTDEEGYDLLKKLGMPFANK